MQSIDFAFQTCNNKTSVGKNRVTIGTTSPSLSSSHDSAGGFIRKVNQMIVFSTDNRMSNNQSSFHLVFFKVDDIALRYTELSAEQQVEANKIYPVTFEARQAFRQSREAVEQMRAADGACDFDHVMLALEGHSTCQNCGAIPPHR